MQIGAAGRRPGCKQIVAGAVLLALGAATPIAVPAAIGSPAPPKPKVVTVADFYFGPDEVTVKRGGAVKWVWAATNTYPHDVHLKRGPKGLARRGTYSTRTSAVTNARFERTFPTPGTYRFICTIHPTQMKLKVTVLGGRAAP